jgi:hypothetical protein
MGDTAVEGVRKIISLDLHRQGCWFLEQRNVTEALKCFEEALSAGLDPLVGIAERWTARMLAGDFEGAWQETDRLESIRRTTGRANGQLRWDGRDFSNKTVLLNCDHGLGDAVQFLRYAPRLRSSCRRLIVKARPALWPLLDIFKCIDEVVPNSIADPTCEVAMECSELPYVFRTTLNTIPSDVPYMDFGYSPTSPAQKRGIAVGLCWAAGPWNPVRSIPLSALLALRHVKNATFVNLQWGQETADAARYPKLFESSASFHASVDGDLRATALAILDCDLVLTVDTMVAHLAGALAKPVLVLLHFDSDWRWMLDRTDSPWYPTMKLFRQVARGDWVSPACRAVECVKTFAANVGGTSLGDVLSDPSWNDGSARKRTLRPNAWYPSECERAG